MIIAITDPPRELEMPGSAELLFSIFGGLLLLGCITIGVKRLREVRDSSMLLLLLGGALASLLEPAIDVFGLMYIHEEGATRAFSFLDRSMPWFVVTSYAGYIGGCTWWAYRYLSNGITVERILKQWGIFVLANIAFETPAVLLDVYTYFGPQPLSPWGFPFWFGFINPVSSLVGGAILVHLDRRRITGVARHALTPLLVPFAHGSAYACAALPMWITLNEPDLAHAWRYVASAVTLGLVLTVLYLTATLFGDHASEHSPKVAT